MAQIIKEIAVDVLKKNLFQAIVAKQHDSNSRFLKVTILREGEALTIEQSSNVIINAERADNESKSFMGSVNADGTVTVPLTNWMLELDDFVRCDISIIDSEERKLTSTSFTIEVEAAANEGDDISEDENYDILITLLSECSASKEACDTATATATSAAERAETFADNADTATANANAAKTACDTATTKANTATSKANTAASKADTATKNAETATARATAITAEARTVIEAAETATENAETATTETLEAKADAETATQNANSAATNATEKATLADQKASLAQEKATAAEEATVAAQEATENAVTATTNAETATEEANAAAERAETAAAAVGEEIDGIMVKDTTNSVNYLAQFRLVNGKPAIEYTEI